MKMKFRIVWAVVGDQPKSKHGLCSAYKDHYSVLTFSTGNTLAQAAVLVQGHCACQWEGRETGGLCHLACPTEFQTRNQSSPMRKP